MTDSIPMTEMTERELLRLHIEAVWSISIPPLEGATVALSDDSPPPPWSLYRATLAHEQVTIWRPNVAPEERADLLRRASQSGAGYDAALGMRREVVLWHTAPLPPETPETPEELSAPHGVRRLTAADAPLLERFEADSAAYFLDAHHAPCIGVIVDGALVSVAHSSRRTAQACELGINTLPDARRHGYATTATLAWTRAIRQESLCPIYSAFAQNTASLRLAAASGYTRVCESVYGPVVAPGE